MQAINNPLKTGHITALQSTPGDLCNLVLEHRQKPGEHMIVIRGVKSQTEAAFFQEIGAALQLPYYFGDNWAALDECLNDMDWMPEGTLFLVVSDYGKLFAKEPDQAVLVKKFLALMHRAMEDWKAGNNGREMQLGVITHQEP